MTARHTKFYLDKQNKKWLGVCAGMADYTGIDVTVIRIATFIGVLLSQGSLLLAYLIAAWIAPKKPVDLYETTPEQKKFWQGVRTNPRRITRDVRSRFRDLDRRLADMEAYVTDSNRRLAREIEELR